MKVQLLPEPLPLPPPPPAPKLDVQVIVSHPGVPPLPPPGPPLPPEHCSTEPSGLKVQLGLTTALSGLRSLERVDKDNAEIGPYDLLVSPEVEPPHPGLRVEDVGGVERFPLAP